MDTADKRATAALWSVRGVGPVTLAALRDKVPSLGDLLERPIREWRDRFEWHGGAVAHLAALTTLAQRADWLEAKCRAQLVELVFPDHPAWPDKLNSIPDVPALLFCRGPGARAPRRRRLAIVGPRMPELGLTSRAHDIAQEAARLLGIVSGAAEGIDTAAHQGAIKEGGETWAFMGSGLDQLDPTPRATARFIVDHGGTVFSEFPPGFRPNTSSFQRRNRLISGVSDAVLVVRAAVGSGSLHTARFAKEQGRPVLVTPAEPWNQAAAGSNALLREAHVQPHLGVNDLIRACGLSDSISSEKAPPFDASGLEGPLREVFDLLGRGAANFEGLLSELAHLNSGQISAALTRLEVLGAVIHKGSRRYEKR
jgi:DNA processing protein